VPNTVPVGELLPPDEPNPWVFHTTATKYENPWIHVTESAVTRPDGNPGIYGIVHYRNRAVAIVPIDDDGYTWLVGQYRPVTGNYSWEVPEGGVPFDEDLVEGASRELAEETGLIASHFELVNETCLSNSVSDERAYVLVATGLTQGAADPEGTEKLRILRIHTDDVLRLIDAGLISDSFTVIAMLTIDRWRRNRPVR
jgi:8-oxo-dGTP pyrophosphatase MutT (NUDIX family)